MSSDKGRILVVVDEANDRKALEERLRVSGYLTEMAGDEQEALQVLENFEPDVVLIDLHEATQRDLDTVSALVDRTVEAHRARSASDVALKPVTGVTMAELERDAILKTLQSVHGNTAQAAERLGISRRKIQYRLKEWGLTGSFGAAEHDDTSKAS